MGGGTAAGHSSRILPVRRLTASPMSAVAPVAGAAGSRGPLLIQTRKDYFDNPPAMPLQRATAESQSAGLAGESASTGPSPPTGEPTPNPESLDLERLADQVYAILEQRLTIERESLGL